MYDYKAHLSTFRTLICDEINNNLVFPDHTLSGRSRSKFAVYSSDK